MAKIKSPLGPADLETLNRLLKECEETAAYCKTCEECNLDVDPEKTKNEEQMEIARKLKAKFFPKNK